MSDDFLRVLVELVLRLIIFMIDLYDRLSARKGKKESPGRKDGRP